MPPLGEHKEDIEELCTVFLDEFNTIHGKSVTMSREAIDCLKEYDFPGNTRELRNLMERASVLCSGSEIRTTDLPVEICQKSNTENNTFNLSAQMTTFECTQQE